jgi:hypothetical protein
MSEQNLSARDRELLASLVNGDRTPEDPQVRERIAASPEFAHEVAAVQSITAALQQDGALRRAEIEGAAAAVTAADVALARTMIRHHLPRRFWRRPGPWFVAAAAVLMLSAGTWVCWHRAAASEPDYTLATAVKRGMKPSGEVGADELRTFRWEDPTPGGSWLVAVYPARDGRKTGYEPLLPEQRIIGNQWQPTPEQIETMRNAVDLVWELTPVGDGRGATSGASVHCKR